MPAPTKFPQTPRRLSSLTEEFLRFAQVELNFRPESIIKYRDCLRHIQQIVGDLDVCNISKVDVLAIKAECLKRNLSISRQVSFLATLKRFLAFCHSEHGFVVLNAGEITMPRRPWKEVTYLTPQEVERFINSIKLTSSGGSRYLWGLRFRALVEALLGSAMRISELLSLNRDDIDFAQKEARIIGKGGKERVVFFTDRALDWISKYLAARQDQDRALFVCDNGRARLKRGDLWRTFKRHRTLAGITKPLRPHILRHTAATQLLFNGCPVGHIKEILGHERLETTCRYYLGLDHRAAKEAHQRFLTYAVPATIGEGAASQP